MEDFYTVNSLAKHWGVSDQFIRLKIKSGELTPIKVCGVIRFSKEYIEQLEQIDTKAKSWLEIKQKKRITELEEEVKKLKKILYKTSSVINGALGGVEQ